MSLSLSIQIDKGALKRIHSKIRSKLVSKQTLDSLSNSILGMKSISSWLAFLPGKQFHEDFGVFPGIGASWAAKMIAEIGKIRVTVGKDFIQYNAIDQDKLRLITSWAWGDINVNAWDTYEYGIISGRRSRGIAGYHIDRSLSQSERKTSRSGTAKMKPGGRFLMQAGNAPRVFSVRAEAATSAEKFAQSIKRKIKI